MQYIVKLAQAAEQVFQALEFSDQQELDRALAEELADGPNADKEIHFDADGGFQVHADPGLPGDVVCYTATPLSFKAYTAIHRPMTKGELAKVSAEASDLAADHGFYVFDILPAESAFTRRPGGLAAAPARRRRPNRDHDGDPPPGDDPGQIAQ